MTIPALMLQGLGTLGDACGSLSGSVCEMGLVFPTQRGGCGLNSVCTAWGPCWLGRQLTRAEVRPGPPPGGC